jgi:hypothetical protein
MEDFMQEIIEMNEQHFSRQARHVAGLLLQGWTVPEALASLSSSDLLREDFRTLLYQIQLASLVRACRQFPWSTLNRAQIDDLAAYVRECTGLECS